MSDAGRAEIVMKAGAVVTCEGRALSEVNTMLLVMQHPGVSIVGGFRQWKKAGRYVMKGQKGRSIWIPRGSKSDVPALAGSEMSRRDIVEAADGDAGRCRFIAGTVFDISQTAECGAGETMEDEGAGDEIPAPAVAPELVLLPPVRRAVPDVLALPLFAVAGVETEGA